MNFLAEMMTMKLTISRKIRELHGSLEDSSDEEPLFKEYTKVLKGTGKKSGPIN